MRPTLPVRLAAWVIAALATAPAPAFAKGGAKAPHINPPKVAHRSEPKPPHINPPKMPHNRPPTPHHEGPKPQAQAHHGTNSHAHANPNPQHHGTPHVASRPYRANSFGSYAGGYGRGSYHRYSSRHHYYTRHFGPRRYPVRPNTAALLARLRLQRLMRIRRDLEGLKPGATPTQAQVDHLGADLMAIAEGPARPGKAPVRALAINLAEAMGRRRSGPFNSAGMALYLGELMNGAGTSRANFKPALARGTALLRAAGIGPPDAEVLTDGFRDILAFLNPGAMGNRVR